MTTKHCTVLLGTLVLAIAGCGRQEPAKPAVTVASSATKKEEPEQIIIAGADKFPPPPQPVAKDKQTAQPKIEPPPTKIETKPVVPVRRERVKPTETVSITAETFGAEIRKSADDAAQKFEPKFVELSGVVRSVGSRGNEPYITLDAGPDSLGILCMLAKEKEPWGKVSRGQKVKVKGVWPEIFVQPSLEACELVDAGTNTALDLKAEALAAEFAKGKDAAKLKYQEKTVIVTGVIETRGMKNELGAIRVFLKGMGETRVDCGFNAPDLAEAEGLPLSQPVRIVGEFSAFESIDGPALRGCRVISGK